MKKVISNLKSFKKEGKELHLKMQFLYDKLYYSVPMKKKQKNQDGSDLNVLGRARSRARAAGWPPSESSDDSLTLF